MVLLLTAVFCGITVCFFSLAFFSKSGTSGASVNSRLKELRSLNAEKESIKKGINSKKLVGTLLGINGKKKKAPDQKKKSKSTRELEKMLQLAGYDFTASQWNTLKYGAVLLLGALAYVISPKLGLEGQNQLLAAGGVAAVVMFLFSNSVTCKVKKKKENIRRDLPDIIDLLVVSVEAGLGFDAALVRLYEKNKCDVMEELMRTQVDLRNGISKKDAYSALIARCDSKEMTSFANAVVQSEQMGISMKSVLSTQSESLREERNNRAQEQAEKAPVKMMLPLVLFIFPCIFVILLAPAVASIMGAFM